MQKVKWRFRNSLIEPGTILEYARENGISNIMATVLLNRGINTGEDLNKYIKKSLDSVLNPMGLPDMEKATERIIKAINDKEKITVYGDYDADGVTSTVLLYSFLKDMGANVEYYIPDRMKEGYGLNIMSVNKISKGGTRLLITVDCGIVSFGEIELAKAQKMDVIVTDHHTCGERIPNAYAVINPKRSDSEYGFNALAGVGVAFKLILAITMKLGKSTKECFDKYVVFAAIGTVADVVSLSGENRTIVQKGIESLENCDNFGLNALLELCGANDKKINSTTISFMLSPRINAAGRMGSADVAFKLLMAQSKEEAYELSLKLDEMNRERQKIERIIFDEAIEMIESDPNFDKKGIIVLKKEGWHHGIVGIVAARITDIYYKPCILIAEENGIGKGSGRSVEGINLFDLLDFCRDHLTKYGGHAQAAGLSLDISEFDEFVKKLNAHLKATILEEPVKTIDIDCSVPSSYITIQNAKALEYLEPYGADNEKPVFAMSGVEVVSARAIGVDNKHLKLNILSGKMQIEAVGFGFGDYAKFLQQGKHIDIAFNLDINRFNSKESVQLIIKAIKESQA